MSVSPAPAPPTPRHEERPPRRKVGLIWKMISIAFGSAMILLGLVALVTPGPGILMILAGLAALGPHSKTARAAIRKLKEKFGITRRVPGEIDEDEEEPK